MIIKEKITALQLFSILFISRILVSLTYVPALSSGSFSTDLFLTVPLSFLIMTIMFIPMYILLKKHKGQSVLDCAEDISSVFVKIIAVLFLLFFVYNGASAISRFTIFVTSSLQPRMPAATLAVSIVLVSCYIAWLGIEPLGRFSAIMVPIMCIGVLIIFTGVIPKMSALNFEPILYRGYGDFWDNVLSTISQTVEIAALAILAPMAGGKVRKGFFLWLTGLSIFMMTIAFSVIGVLGNFSESQLFPVYITTVLSEFSVIKRLCALQTAIWLSGVIIKVSYLCILSDTCFSKLAKQKKGRNLFFPLSGVIIIILSLVFSKNFQIYTQVSSAFIGLIFNILLIIIIPIIILICKKIKGRKQKV